MLGSKQSPPAVKMMDGPVIWPSAPLLEWLNRNARLASGQYRLFRLPVVVYFEDEYRLELGDAFIGASEKNLGSDAIALSLDTGAMGISLWSLLNERCPKTSTACAVWLDGYWGSSIEFNRSDTHKIDQKWPFTVVCLHRLIDARTQRAKTIRAFLETDR